MYRAPELILIQKHYDFSVDIWALGCVLAELMATSKQYLEQHKFCDMGDGKRCNMIKTCLADRHLFKGKSCYPLSPCAKGYLREHDQIEIIN